MIAGIEAPRRRTRRTTASLVLALVVAAGGCDPSELLEVELPGVVPEEDLDDPALADALVTGAIADFECAWDNYVAGSAIQSDEYWYSTPQVLQRYWGARRITADEPNFATGGCEGGGYGFYTPLQTARFQAESVYDRLAGFTDEVVPDRTSKMATVRAYGGFALVAFGEGFCSAAFDTGPELMPEEVLRLAEARFTDAIDLAAEAGNEEIRLMALVGRARARLDLKDFEGAIADAAQVPAGWTKWATRDASGPRRHNTMYEAFNGPPFKDHTVAPAYRDVAWKGVPDPRVNVTTNGETGRDGTTIHYFHDKATTRGSPVLVASYKEAQLFIAEAAARTGDLATARRIINERHELAGIPPFEVADGPEQADVIRHVIEERRRELFAEGGHRLNDHLRFRGTPFDVPFKGEPGSYHPDGLDHFGLQYGETTCWPLPTIERQGNPNVS